MTEIIDVVSPPLTLPDGLRWLMQRGEGYLLDHLEVSRSTWDELQGTGGANATSEVCIHGGLRLVLNEELPLGMVRLHARRVTTRRELERTLETMRQMLKGGA